MSQALKLVPFWSVHGFYRFWGEIGCYFKASKCRKPMIFKLELYPALSIVYSKNMRKLPLKMSFVRMMAAFVLMLVVGCTQYVNYIPIVFVVERGDHLLREDPTLLNHEHIAAMKFVLKKYDEPFKEENGLLLITKSLQDNHDLLQNYTSKAEAYRSEKQSK